MAKEKITGSANAVDAQHSACTEWLEISHLPRTLLGGTRAMKAARETYLPKDLLENKKDYENKLKRSTLVNMYRKTVTFLAGQVFAKKIVFDESLPGEILEYQDDCDLIGTSSDTFLKRAFEIGIGEGVFHILIDSNNVDGTYTSKEEEKEDGVRTYFRGVKQEDIIGFIDENGLLLQVRIKETKTERNGDFGIDFIPQIRVLDPGYWRVYQKSKGKKEWQLIEHGESSVDYIPIVSFIPGERLSLITGETPLSDLADLNLDHWQSKSDQKNVLHIARAPKMFGKLIDADVINANVQSAIVSSNANSDLKFVEISGKSIEAGQKDLTEIESKMALYGLQQLIPRTGNQTATEKALSSAESNSSLGTWVSIFESCVRQCFSIVADFEKIKDFDVSGISINKDFTTGIIDPEMVKVYIGLVENEIISSKTAFDEIKKKGFLSEELDWIEVTLEIDQERKTKDGKSLLDFGE